MRLVVLGVVEDCQFEKSRIGTGLIYCPPPCKKIPRPKSIKVLGSGKNASEGSRISSCIRSQIVNPSRLALNQVVLRSCVKSLIQQRMMPWDFTETHENAYKSSQNPVNAR